MITTVIFDIGNVLAEFAWKPFVEELPFSEEIKHRIVKATVLSPLWNELDRGEQTTEELVDGFVQNDAEIEKEIRYFFENISGIIRRFDYAIPWITELKNAGYQVLVLSNFPELIRGKCAKALDFLDHVDGGILSYLERVIKPDSPIYELLIQRYGLEPQACVFLDDKEENLTVPGSMGIKTVLFSTKSKAILDLEKLGVYKDGKPVPVLGKK